MRNVVKLVFVTFALLVLVTGCNSSKETEQSTDGEQDTVSAERFGNHSSHPAVKEILEARKLGNAGEVGRAVFELEKVVKEYPQFAYGHHMFGFFLQRADRFEESIEPNRRAVELEPNNSFYRGNFARSLMKTGKFEQAKIQNRMAITLCEEKRDPNCNQDSLFISFLMQAEIVKNLGQTEIALQWVDRALQLRPDDAGARRVREYVLN